MGTLNAKICKISGQSTYGSLTSHVLRPSDFGGVSHRRAWLVTRPARKKHMLFFSFLPIRVGVAVHVFLVVEAVQPLPRLHEGELSAEGDLLPLRAAAVPCNVGGAPSGAVQARAASARVEN